MPKTKRALQLDPLSVRMTLRAVECGLNVPDALKLCSWCLDGDHEGEEDLYRFLRLAIEAGDMGERVVMRAPKPHGEEQ